MQRFILGRIVQAVVSVVVVSLIVFLLVRLTGSPVDVYLPMDATERDRHLLTAKFGLDRPVYFQYALFIKNAVRGDFGESLKAKEPALKVVKRHFMTARDVKFSSDLLPLEGTNSQLTGYFRTYVKGIEVVDDYTVAFHLLATTFDFFTRLSNQLPYFTVASKKYVETVGKEASNRHPIGTGPWKFVEYSPGNYAKYKAVENHWRYTPDFEYLIMREVPDTDTRVMMLRAGDLDATDVPLALVPQLEKAGFKIITTLGFPFYVQFNGLFLTTRPTFDTNVPWVGDYNNPDDWGRALKVRKAMAMAIDTKKILDSIFYGKGELTAVPAMLPSQPGYDPNWKQYPYDPAAARKLLAEAGYPKGFEAVMHVFPLAGRGELVDMDIAVAAMLEEIGIKVNIKKVDYVSVDLPMRRARTFTGLTGYAYTFLEAISIWDIITHSTALQLWIGEHPDLDKMIKATTAELDFNKRAKMQRDIGQWMIDNVWAIPVATKATTFAVNPKRIRDWQLVPLFAYAHQFEYLFKAQ